MSPTARSVFVGPVQLRCTTPGEAVLDLVDGALRGGPRHVHLLNAYSIALAERDLQYRTALSGDALNLPDGKPLSWVSSVRRDDPPLRQVRGPQLFLDLLDQGRRSDLRHFLLGSTPATLKQLSDSITEMFPNIAVVGSESPPFRTLTPAELEAQDRRIRESGANIIWVGLGTPKQDFEARRLAASCAITTIAVGAAFDFAAGTKKEAPAWMRRLGLEWVYRFATEPRRLWKRYLIGNFVFIWSAIRSRSEQDR